MFDAKDPTFAALYPDGAFVRDRWGRLIPGVIACYPETGEVISYDGTWRTGLWLWLTRRLKVAAVTHSMFIWMSPSGEILRRHGFWPAPLRVEPKPPRFGHVNCRCSLVPVRNATAAERLATP